MGLLKERLAPRGVLAINLAGSLKHETFMTASVVKTAKSAFGSVDIYPTFLPEAGEGWGNLAIIAYNFPSTPLRQDAVRHFPIHPWIQKGVREALGSGTFRFSPDTPAIVLSDDYNPIDFYDLWLKENIRNNLLQNTNWDIMI
jgi:hypothetical protein